MARLRAFVDDQRGLATVEYIVGAAVILGTLAAGITAWNNGLVARLQALVAQIQGIN